MSYTHLSQDERYQIQYLHGGGFSARASGMELKRAATTTCPSCAVTKAPQARIKHEPPSPERNPPTCGERTGLDRSGSVGSRGSALNG